MIASQPKPKTLPSPTEVLVASKTKYLGIRLSARELEVLKLVVEGCTNREIAIALHISHNTVKTHVRSILNKLGVNHRIQVAVLALRYNLV